MLNSWALSGSTTHPIGRAHMYTSPSVGAHNSLGLRAGGGGCPIVFIVHLYQIGSVRDRM